MRSYLTHILEKGTSSWDIVISQCLSTALVAGLGARAGDVAQSNGYTGEEYMQGRHAELCLVRVQPAVAPKFTKVRAAASAQGLEDRPGRDQAS